MISHPALGAPDLNWLTRMRKAGENLYPAFTHKELSTVTVSESTRVNDLSAYPETTAAVNDLSAYPPPTSEQMMRRIPSRPVNRANLSAPELSAADTRERIVNAWFIPEWVEEETYPTVFGKQYATAGADW